MVTVETEKIAIDSTSIIRNISKLFKVDDLLDELVANNRGN